MNGSKIRNGEWITGYGFKEAANRPTNLLPRRTRTSAGAMLGASGGPTQPDEISARVYRGVPLFDRAEIPIAARGLALTDALKRSARQGTRSTALIRSGRRRARRLYADLSYLGFTVGLPPGVPGGGITGIFAPLGGGVCLIPGSIPLGGVITPSDRFSSELRDPLAGGTIGLLG
jgi:hypothetical protein